MGMTSLKYLIILLEELCETTTACINRAKTRFSRTESRKKCRFAVKLHGVIWIEMKPVDILYMRPQYGKCHPSHHARLPSPLGCNLRTADGWWLLWYLSDATNQLFARLRAGRTIPMPSSYIWWYCVACGRNCIMRSYKFCTLHQMFPSRLCSGSALDLYYGYSRFEWRPGHRMPWQMSGSYLD
jgi:hypothetical protein